MLNLRLYLYRYMLLIRVLQKLYEIFKILMCPSMLLISHNYSYYSKTFYVIEISKFPRQLHYNKCFSDL